MFVDIICMLTAAMVVSELVVAVGGVALANSQRANNEGGPAGLKESEYCIVSRRLACGKNPRWTLDEILDPKIK